LTELTTGTADVTVNDTSVAQSWNGIGGTFNEVGWNILSMLSAADRDRAIKLLFDATDGARFSYGRIPIGASDYAMSRYTLDETANDVTMAAFSVDRDKQKLIPYIQAALAVKPDIHFWASPWTPPTWMKSNNAMDGGNMKEDATTLTALAVYLARFVEEYAKVGITIEAIHPQNEPGYSTNYPSCLWTAAGITKFIGTYLGPTFASRGITADIYLGTMSNADSGKDGTIISTVNADTTASKYVKGYGLQWNMLPSVSGLKSRNLPIVQSEHKCGNYPWNPSGFPAFNPNTAPNDYAYAVESWGYIRDWIKAGVNVYSAWNMVLDTAGKNLDSMRPWPQNALLTVDTTAKTLIVTPAYYVFRHVSQYVDPGATVVGTTGGDALAFKNPDGTIVAVLYNSGAAKKMTVAVAGKKEQFDMPANGWATINWKK
jgi:glucosylceramidase